MNFVENLTEYRNFDLNPTCDEFSLDQSVKCVADFEYELRRCIGESYKMSSSIRHGAAWI